MLFHPKAILQVHENDLYKPVIDGCSTKALQISMSLITVGKPQFLPLFYSGKE